MIFRVVQICGGRYTRRMYLKVDYDEECSDAFSASTDILSMVKRVERIPAESKPNTWEYTSNNSRIAFARCDADEK